MARIDVRYLTTRPGRQGGLPRYYWQPKTALQKQGWTMRRIPADWASQADPAALELAAIAAARDLNAELDAWRGGKAPADASPAAPAARPTPPPVRSVSALVHAYTRDRAFTRLAASTRRTYRQSLDVLEEWAGDQLARALTPKMVQSFYNDLVEATPAKANNFVRTASALFKYGRIEGWVAVNPAAKLDLEALDPSARIWPRLAVREFVAEADRLGHHALATTIVLNEWIGQRKGDMFRLGRGVLRAGGHALRQGKTKASVLLPVDAVPHLVARVELELRRQAAAAEASGRPLSTRLVVDEASGAPYEAKTFDNHFVKVRASLAARIPVFTTDYLIPGADPESPEAFALRTEELWWMHLRHTAVTRLAESRCTVPEIAAITGHSEKSVEAMLRRYLVRTGTLARQAFARRLEAEGLAVNETGEKSNS